MEKVITAEFDGEPNVVESADHESNPAFEADHDHHLRHSVTKCPLLPQDQDTGQESLTCLNTKKEDLRCKNRIGQDNTSRAAHFGVEHNEGEDGSDAALPEQASENKIGPSDMAMVTSLDNCTLENGNEQDDLFRVCFGFDMDREIALNVKIQGEFHVTLLYVDYFPSSGNLQLIKGQDVIITAHTEAGDTEENAARLWDSIRRGGPFFP